MRQGLSLAATVGARAVPTGSGELQLAADQLVRMPQPRSKSMLEAESTWSFPSPGNDPQSAEPFKEKFAAESVLTAVLTVI